MSAAFFVFGVFWGGWAVATLDVERSLHLSNAGFGALISVALLGASAGNAAGGPASERWGSARVLSLALTAWGALLVVGSAVHQVTALSAVMAATIATGGLIDVSMNVAASATLAATPGYLVRFHGRFNFGAAAGAALIGVLDGAGDGWRPAWTAIGIAALVLAALCTRSAMPAAAPGDAVPLAGAFSVLRAERLVPIALAFALSAMVEGGVELWGVLYLRTRLASGLLIGAGGAVLAYLVAGVARTVLGERAGRRGPAIGILVGAGTAAAGTALLAGSPLAALAAAGLVVASGGISMCWPLFIARAAAGRDRPGAGVGALSAFGYLGLVAGPGLVGVFSRLVGLRWGLAGLAAAAVVVAAVPLLTARGEAVKGETGRRPDRRGPLSR